MRDSQVGFGVSENCLRDKGFPGASQDKTAEPSNAQEITGELINAEPMSALPVLASILAVLATAIIWSTREP